MLAAALLAAAFAAPARAQVVAGRARFTVVTPELIRLEWRAGPRFVDAPSLFALERGARWDGYRVARSSAGLSIDTGRLRLVYVPDGKPFSAANLRAEIAGPDGAVEWRPGLWSARDLGGARNLDNTKGPAPMAQGLLSRDGWHLIDDSKGPLLAGGWAEPRPEGAGLDWYLFGYGDDYKGALKSLTAISGPVPLPRRYALGSWYSRWWAHSDADVRRIVGEYAAHGFPLDVFVLDTDWHRPGDWTGYSWNRALFPDPPGLLRWLHARGLFVALNDHLEGSVKPFEDRYADFMRALGRDPASKAVVPFDAGDRARMDALFKTVYAPLEADGVDFWWLDYWSEDPAHPLNHLRWVNELYYRHSQSRGRRGLIFSRWGDWGNQRAPVNFSGDTYALWSTLAFQVPFTANAGNAGAFFWAHDVGGYQGERDGELYARWAQFAAFSAALRPHSMNKPWLDKRPWSYPKEIEDSLRRSFRLRAELFPYTYSSVRQSCRDSVPLLRPLYLEYPRAEAAYANPQEYLYGDDFLVAPIVSSGTGPGRVASQTVWFPEGVWYSWFDGARYEGPRADVFAEGLDAFPLFARGGVPIPARPFTERMATAPLDALIVRAYPGEKGKLGTSVLYEDDGLTTAYSTGAYAETRLTYLNDGTSVNVSISSTAGSYSGQPDSRSIVVELPGVLGAVEAAANGAPAAAVRDANSVLRVDLGRRPIRAPVVLRVTPAPVTPAP